MGHNQRNANRAAGIAKNAERCKELSKRVKSLELEAKAGRRALEMEVDRRRRHETAFIERVEALERPLWKKAADWIRSSYRRYFPLPPTDFEIVEVEPLPEELETVEDLDKEPPVELEIVGGPKPERLEDAERSEKVVAELRAEHERKRAAELTDGPPDG